MITKEEARKRLSINVKRIRKLIGMTQEELCEQSNVNQSTISKLERGAVLPNVVDFANLAEALNTTTEVLLRSPECARERELVEI